MRAKLLNLYLLAGLLGSISPRPAHADIRDLFHFLTPNKAQAPGTVAQAPARRLLLNGYPLDVTIGKTPESTHAVLDFYERRYKGHHEGNAPFPTFRKEEDDTGILVTANGTLQSLLGGAASREPQTATLPPLCWVFAQRMGDMTSYFAMFSDGPLPASVVSPQSNHDAPGGDVPGIPRPYGSTRSFNLVEPQAGYAMVSYLVDLPPESAFSRTVEQLRNAGFVGDSAFAQSAAQTGNLILYLSRKGQDLMVSANSYVGNPQRSLVLYVTRNH